MLKLYAAGLLLSFFLCYFEWGQQQALLIEIQYELLCQKNSPQNWAHPLIIGPAIGQVLLLISLFKAKRKVILTAAVLLGVLVAFVLLGAALAAKTKMIVSVLPFVVILSLFCLHYKQLPQ